MKSAIIQQADNVLFHPPADMHEKVSLELAVAARKIHGRCELLDVLVRRKFSKEGVGQHEGMSERYDVRFFSSVSPVFPAQPRCEYRSHVEPLAVQANAGLAS